MSAHIRFSSENQIVKSGFALYVEYPTLHLGQEWIPTNVSRNDLMVNFLQQATFFCPTATRPIGHLFGFPESVSRYTDIPISFPVTTTKEPYLGYDVKMYSSFLRNIQLFGAFLTGNSLKWPRPFGEHYCRHYTFSGEFITEQADVPFVTTSVDFYGYTIPVRSTDGHLYDVCTVNSVHPLSVTVTPTLTTAHNCDVLMLLDELMKFEVTSEWALDGSHHWTRTMSNLQYEYTSDSLRISYHMWALLHEGIIVDEWDSIITFRFLRSADASEPEVDQVFTSHLGTFTSARFEYLNATTSYPYDDGGRKSESCDLGHTFPICLSLPNPLVAGEEVRINVTVNDLLSSRFLDKFRVDVEAKMYDITSSCIFSAADAFKSIEGSLGVNVLQDLQKIPSIVSALPQIKEGLDVLGKISRRDLSGSTFREILDLATSTKLQGDFQWRPFLGLFTDYLPRMLSTIRTIGLPSGRVVGYGSRSFRLHNVVGRAEVNLLTRTKIVMDSSSSGLLSASLGLDALGLLPKVSNLWDLIPFTFVVNWFSGIGEAMRRAEYSTIMASIPAYFVHSYLVTSPLTPFELEKLSLSSSSASPASMRLYFRDLTSYNPYVRDNGLGLGMPASLPPIGTLGSLLYQLIF